MDAHRRQIVTGLGVALAASGATTATQAAAPPIAAPVVHHVFFWLKEPGSPRDRAALVAGLRTLAGIPAIRGLHIGVPAPTEQRDVVDASFDVSELMLFDDVAGQKSYQDHPLHLRFVETCSGLWRKVVVYDVLRA